MNAYTVDPTAAVERLQEVGNTVKANVEAALKTSTDALTKQYGEAVSKAQAEVEKAGEAALKAATEINQFGKDNVDAVVSSGNIVVKAAEDLNKLALRNVQSGFKTAMSAAKSLAGAKSYQEVVEVQASLAKTGYETWVAQSTKVAELSQKAADKASAPIRSRVEAAVAELRKPLAA